MSIYKQFREAIFKASPELEKEIDKAVAQSQPKEVLRDTDYQIRRMEDAIELAYIEEGMSAEGRRIIWLEWSEIKKILLQL